MSVVKSYSDARKELERIASQRKHFFNNSKSLRDEMSNSKQNYARLSTDRNSYKSTGLFCADSSIGLTASSANLPYSPPVNYQSNYRASSSSSPTNGINSIRHSTDRIHGLHTHQSQHNHQDVASSSLGLGSASSVIGAFRQLQAKSRVVEQERADAFKERDYARKQLSELSQSQNFYKNQSEMQTSDSYLKIKSASEQLEANRRDLELQILTLQELIASTQRSNSNDRGVFLSLQGDISNINDTVHSLKCSNRGIEGELTNANKRNSRIGLHNDQLPSGRSKQSGRLEDSINNISEQIATVTKATYLSKIRCDALQRYMELILKINGDVSKRIADTVSARAHIRNLAERLTPPRYAWPKELPYDCMQNIVSEAAAERTKEENGKINKERQGFNSFYNHSQGHDQTESGTYFSNVDPNDDFDTEYESDDINDIKLDLDNKWARGGYNDNLSGVGQGRTRVGISREKEKGMERERGHAFDLDAAYRALSGDPNKRRASSFQGRATSNSQQGRRKGAPSSSSTSSGSGVRVRSRGGSRSVSAPKVRDSGFFTNGINSLRSTSPNLARPPVSYMVLDKHDSAYNQAVSTAAAAVLSGMGGGGGGGLEGSRAGFIPGGNTEGKEFNVIAKGSKIARATTHFNAAVAARVKAYKKDLVGDDLLNIVMGGASRD